MFIIHYLHLDVNLLWLLQRLWFIIIFSISVLLMIILLLDVFEPMFYDKIEKVIHQM